MKYFTLFFSIILTPLIVFSDNEYTGQAELYIINYSSDVIKSRVFPLGAVFNGRMEYNLKCKYPKAQVYTYIVAGELSEMSYNYIYELNHDADPSNDTHGAIGYGKYRVEIYKKVGQSYVYVDYIDVDFGDADYPASYTGNFIRDLPIFYYSSTNIQYWSNTPIPSARYIPIWDQTVRNQSAIKDPNINGFKTSNSDNGLWLDFPLYATWYGGVEHLIPGICYLNLSIEQGHSADILSSELFKMEYGTTLYLKSNSNTKLNVLTSARLNIGVESKCIIEAYSSLNMYSNCTLLIYRSGEVRVKPNGFLCNFGGRILGAGRIIYEGTVRCAGYQDFIIEDSTQIILEDNASWELEANSVVTIQGSHSALIMKPGSQIKFGTNSKLVLKNGAPLIANNATFTSLSPGQTWDGIYLEDVAQDTITNCTIENASNGITIRNRYTAAAAPFSAEITGCTFSNNTTSQLNYGLSASNSTNILFRNNIFTSSVLVNGFSRGVVMEYCPQGSLLIIDNVITNAETGISILQSSPYIARNSITGQSGVEYGIYLDNSNGTVEYNIVNNFQYSLYGFYSSPYLLKNTFSNASIRNIELNSSSIPVMRPLVSGSTLYWLGGDNIHEGSPTGGGIGFNNDAFPEMDSGYNRITLNSGSNYMDGTVPPMLGGTLYARLNYWREDPPNPEKFIIYDGTIDYDPWSGGEPPLAADGFILNDIGFGLYDTVFTKSLGQSPSEDLFIQAYNKERTGQYNEAITLYKQVITLYRTSTYAPLSLSRIFNCAEKKRSTNGEYTLFESYFRLINTNNIHSRQLRELAEDYVIRAKVRQGRLNDAIADYTEMYQQNLNTPKGQHALANKQSLERIRDNSYGQQSANSFMFIQPDNNQTISNTPKEFRLYQNYPNPFNPITTIKYDLPSDGIVKIVIYDVTGKEIYFKEEFKTIGFYRFIFDGTNCSSGLYFYSLETGNFKETKKMILIK